MDSLSHEAVWWGDCANTWSEEMKQIEYAVFMGLNVTHDDGHYPAWDIEGRNVVDIGGGPVSMLLKATNPGPSLAVVDPSQWPGWVHERYRLKNIVYSAIRAEDFEASIPYDECWIYNVLQHTEDPALVVANAKKSARKIRVFEWIDIPGDVAHPQVLTQANLEGWFGAKGWTMWGIDLKWNPDAGAWAWYGVFDGV